jgi:HEAT repeat protein
VRATAIDGLWEDDRLLTLRRLLALANDPAQEVQVAALLNLARFAYMAELDELPVDEAAHMSNTLLDLAADMKQPLDVRRRAIEALGYFAEVSEAQAEIGRAYDSNSTQLRESALIAMGRSMRPEWFPLIEREMRSSSPELRFTAAQAAGELGEDGQQLVPALLALIDDDDTEVSTAAVWAMGQIGGAHGERVLERLLHSKNEVLRQAANEALSALRFYEP